MTKRGSVCLPHPCWHLQFWFHLSRFLDVSGDLQLPPKYNGGESNLVYRVQNHENDTSVIYQPQILPETVPPLPTTPGVPKQACLSQAHFFFFVDTFITQYISAQNTLWALFVISNVFNRAVINKIHLDINQTLTRARRVRLDELRVHLLVRHRLILVHVISLVQFWPLVLHVQLQYNKKQL